MPGIVPNVGLVDASVRFIGYGPDLAVYFKPTEIVFAFVAETNDRDGATATPGVAIALHSKQNQVSEATERPDPWA